MRVLLCQCPYTTRPISPIRETSRTSLAAGSRCRTGREPGRQASRSVPRDRPAAPRRPVRARRAAYAGMVGDLQQQLPLGAEKRPVEMQVVAFRVVHVVVSFSLESHGRNGSSRLFPFFRSVAPSINSSSCCSACSAPSSSTRYRTWSSSPPLLMSAATLDASLVYHLVQVLRLQVRRIRPCSPAVQPRRHDRRRVLPSRKATTCRLCPSSCTHSNPARRSPRQARTPLGTGESITVGIIGVWQRSSIWAANRRKE